MSVSVEEEFKTVKELVENVLATDIDSRANDTRLYLECCKYLGCKSIDDIARVNLSIISVHKIRQAIQNKEGKYKASQDVLDARDRRRYAIRDYMSRLG